jgi:hypothetical protein
MAGVTYEKDITGVDRLTAVTEANACVPHMVDVLEAAPLPGDVVGIIAHTCVEATVRFAAVVVSTDEVVQSVSTVGT